MNDAELAGRAVGDDLGGERQPVADLSIRFTQADAKRVLVGLLVIDVLLALCYLTVAGVDLDWGPLRRLYDIGDDLSIPSWFAAVQLLAVGTVLLVTAANKAPKRPPPTSLLVTAGALFLYLSVDESAAIHEKITESVNRRGITWFLFPGNHGAWISVYAVLAVILAVLLRRQLRELWRHHRRPALTALTGAAVYVGGAVVIEVIGYFTDPEGAMDHLQVATEELSELAGVSILFYAALELALEVLAARPAHAEPAEPVRAQ